MTKLVILLFVICAINSYSQVQVNLANGGVYHGIIVKDDKDTLFISDVKNYIHKSPLNIVTAIPKKNIWQLNPQKIQIITDDYSYTGKISFADLDHILLDTGAVYNVFISCQTIKSIAYLPDSEERQSAFFAGGFGFLKSFTTDLSIYSNQNGFMMSLGCSYNFKNKSMSYDFSLDFTVWNNKIFNLYIGPIIFITSEKEYLNSYFQNVNKYYFGINSFWKIKHFSLEGGFVFDISPTSKSGIQPYTKLAYNLELF